jgi:uncharacterized membrane protein YfcA
VTSQDTLLGALFFVAAVLYSSVGHGGASGYLATMGLAGFPAAIMRPTALVMNVAVSSISLYKFSRSGGFAWRLFLPFAVSAMPMAYIGGRTQLPVAWFGALVGLVLLFSAARLFLETVMDQRRPRTARLPPPWWLAISLGAVIGLMSGLTGVGGGIFLSPLLVLTGWATVRESAAPTAAFILVNSVAGLLGLMSSQPTLPDALPYWVALVVAGGLIGASFGARRLGHKALRLALASVLVIAGTKMLL